MGGMITVNYFLVRETRTEVELSFIVSGLNNVSHRSLQWNSHGYDVAKTFGPKLTSVSPVWLQLRRRGPETFDVTGLHDHDPGRGPPPLTGRW